MNVPSSHNTKAIVIGSSTGGPSALEMVLPRFPLGFPAPIFVAQHLPGVFTHSLAGRLSKMCQLKVCEAKNDEVVKAGVIYFASGGNDVTVELKDGMVTLHVQENNESILTPSIDKLMISVAHVYGRGTIGFVMTGISGDSVKGAKAIRDAGGVVLVQDAQSSAVYGMGEDVVDKGYADAEISLRDATRMMIDITYGRK